MSNLPKYKRYLGVDWFSGAVVPGVGSVIKLVKHKGSVYAWRNNTAGKTCCYVYSEYTDSWCRAIEPEI